LFVLKTGGKIFMADETYAYSNKYDELFDEDRRQREEEIQKEVDEMWKEHDALETENTKVHNRFMRLIKKSDYQFGYQNEKNKTRCSKRYGF
jgi:hypothetical protein